MVLNFPFNLSRDLAVAELLFVVSKTCECLGRKTSLVGGIREEITEQGVKL